MNQSLQTTLSRLQALARRAPAALQAELTDIVNQLNSTAASANTSDTSSPSNETSAHAQTSERPNHAPPDDLTQKQIQLYLESAGDYAKMLVDASLDAIISVDMLLRIVEFNPAAERVFGYTKAEVIGKSIEMLYAEPTEGWRVRVKTHDRGFCGEVRNRRKDGELFTSLVRSVKLTNADGEVIGVMGISRDITQQRTLEARNKQQMLALALANRELEQARIAADRANQAKSEFLANMSHEIRTPLTAVLGFADILGDACRDNDAAMSAVNVIRRNGRHLLELLSDSLDYSKLEAGRLELESLPCAFRPLIEEVITLLTPTADKAGITLTHSIEDSLPEIVLTDPTRVRQVLINLVGNAIKFTPAGSVTLRAACTDGEPSGGRQIRIDVIDTGIGIAADKVESLFSPFVQAEISTNRRFGGTGLGLAISRELARLLGGDIVVSSTQNAGSTFTLILPLNPVEVAPPVPPRKNQREFHRPLAGLKILAVDDCADNRMLLTHFLARLGADATIISNGDEALKCVDPAKKAGGFDAILMDMQMPVMDGLEATRLLRSRGYAGRIIALTANSMSDTRERCLRHGFDAHVAKPINWDDLVAAIRADTTGRCDASRSKRDRSSVQAPQVKSPSVSVG